MGRRIAERAAARLGSRQSSSCPATASVSIARRRRPARAYVEAKRRLRSSWRRPPNAACSRSRRAPTGASISPKAARRIAAIAISPGRSRGRRSRASTPISTRYLEALPAYLGQGTITSRNVQRSHEGTTFEASCYTDPLALEPLTGSLSAAIAWFGRWNADAQLRFTTKFADVGPLLDLVTMAAARGCGHRSIRALSPASKAARHRSPPGWRPAPHGGCRLSGRAHHRADHRRRRMAAGVWRPCHDDAASARRHRGLDLTVELITHRFTAGSKACSTAGIPAQRST